MPENETSRFVGSILTRLRNFRRPYDSRRSFFYRQYLGQRDQLYYPDGLTPRSNTFVQYPYSNVEVVVNRILDAFFGFDEWFECRGRGQNDAQAAERMQLVLDYLLKRSNFASAVEDLVRNICIYGHSGIKVDWDWGYDTATVPQPQFATDANGNPVPDAMGQPVVIGYQNTVIKIPRNCPKFYAIDVYDLLVDPDGGYAAHLSERTITQLKREAEQNPELYDLNGIDELESKILKDPKGKENPSNVLIRLAELWDEHNGTVTLTTFNDPEAIAWKERRSNYRAASYSAFRRPVYGGPVIVLQNARPNPFAHGKIPVLHTSYVRLPNEPYGIGVIEPISEMSESLSKFVNMIVDNWNLGINKRYAYDTGADLDHDALNTANVPGGKVAVSGDPTKAIFPLPFFTPNAGDYTIIDLYRGMIEMTSGISDFYAKGVGSPTGNRTATGILQVMGETNSKFKGFISNLTKYVLQPMLGMVASMVQQFVTDEIEFRITDETPGIPKYVSVNPEELSGNFDFELLAGEYVSNPMIRQRNLLAFVQIVGQSPFWREYEGIKYLAKEFRIRNAGILLKTPQEVAMEQQQAMMQQLQMQEQLAEAQHGRDAENILLQGAVNTESKARLAQAKPQPVSSTSNKGKAGRPATKNFEGKIPGAGLSTVIRDLAQSMGANTLGMEGTDEGGLGAL